MKTMRFLVVVVALVSFTLVTTVALAAEFYVVKDAAGKTAVVDQKPADAKAIVKGPFATKDEAEKAMGKAESASKKPTKLPDQGC